MKTNYKITIPEPCHEDWNKMKPDQTGRFCNSCVKSVVDFTNMNAPEIQEYFIQNQDKKICGRFKNEQVNKFDIQIPQSVLKGKLSFHKTFLLALFIAMGSTLFSCKNHDDATLGEVTVVKDTIENTSKDSVDEEILGKVDMIKYDSLVKAGVKMPKLPPTPPVKQVKFVKTSKPVSNIKKVTPYLTGDVILTPHDPSPAETTKKDIYNASEVEILPNFPGGLTQFYDYFKSNFKVPEESKDITTKLIFSFVVDTDGSLVNIKLLRGINSSTDKEAMRVLKASPKWIPGEQNGLKVKVQYSLPIKITAQ